MKKMYNCGAGCERGNSQVLTVCNEASPSILALFVASLKLHTRFRLVAFHIESNSKGFFTSAASDAIDNLLKSARCTEQIGNNLRRMRTPRIVVTANAQASSRPATTA